MRSPSTMPHVSLEHDADSAYMTSLREDLKVWPAGALPASTIALVKPAYEGALGFVAMKEALYAKAESKDTGTLAKFDIRVQDNEIGYVRVPFVPLSPVNRWLCRCGPGLGGLRLSTGPMRMHACMRLLV
jgi:hypothetical protein